LKKEVNLLTTISIRIEEEEKEALQKYAKEHDLTVSQVVRRAIKEFLLADKTNKMVDALNQIPN
jgi:predicted transcriptional regulator